MELVHRTSGRIVAVDAKTVQWSVIDEMFPTVTRVRDTGRGDITSMYTSIYPWVNIVGGRDRSRGCTGKNTGGA